MFSWKVYTFLNPNLVGLSGVLFEVGRGELLLPPCLKLVRIMLETLNLARKYTHTYVVPENIPFSTKALLILMMPAFFAKNQRFFPK